ncbi:hypothetical protein Tdes44962_MAKER06159 [Teratosphaeria destructans]|uniref:RWD domain-containing protein n=1 Tax=Teratosphaeria destructans TaxID=418781 RepID=A0A9W7SHY3_9PEZI|nr:hypothetical protein Tdes44962_MAKER06159 [Teratosphaeria destructans]
MSEELQDEVISINSIYNPTTLAKLPSPQLTYALTLPSQPSISVRIEFPPTYPDAPPSILGTQHVGDEVAKGAGTHLVELLRDVLSDIYTPGAPCIFDLVEESGQRLQDLGLDAREPAVQEQQDAEANGAPACHAAGERDSDEPMPQSPEDLGAPPPWVLSDVITEKKSIFVARAAAVTSIDQAKQNLAHLLSTDKKVAKATHNITAWRIRGENGVQYQDCDDDGETAAGGRLLHLLELMGVWDAMVVVTRWYGGVQLGPDRFRIINQTAREALVKGGFAPEGGKEGSKKKGKK